MYIFKTKLGNMKGFRRGSENKCGLYILFAQMQFSNN